MNLYKLGLGLIFSGIILAVILAALGFGGFALFIVIPVIYGSGPVMLIPFALILAGILIMMISPFRQYRPSEEMYQEREFEFREEAPVSEEKRRKGRFGAVIMIGPIPIILGNDRKLIYISLIVTVIALLVFLIYYFGR